MFPKRGTLDIFKGHPFNYGLCIWKRPFDAFHYTLKPIRQLSNPNFNSLQDPQSKYDNISIIFHTCVTTTL